MLKPTMICPFCGAMNLSAPKCPDCGQGFLPYTPPEVEEEVTDVIDRLPSPAPGLNMNMGEDLEQDPRWVRTGDTHKECMLSEKLPISTPGTDLKRFVQYGTTIKTGGE